MVIIIFFVQFIFLLNKVYIYAFFAIVWFCVLLWVGGWIEGGIVRANKHMQGWGLLSARVVVVLGSFCRDLIITRRF